MIRALLFGICVLLEARSTRNGAKTRHRPQLSGPALRGSEGRWRVFEGLKTLLASRIALSEHVGGPDVYEKRESGSFHGCQLNDCKFLEASDEASIHRCQPGNVRFLEASVGATWAPCDWTITIVMQPVIRTGPASTLPWKLLQKQEKTEAGSWVMSRVTSWPSTTTTSGCTSETSSHCSILGRGFNPRLLGPIRRRSTFFDVLSVHSSS